MALYICVCVCAKLNFSEESAYRPIHSNMYKHVLDKHSFVKAAVSLFSVGVVLQSASVTTLPPLSPATWIREKWRKTSHQPRSFFFFFFSLDPYNICD